MWRARLSHLVKGVYIQYDSQPHSSGIRAYVAKQVPILQKLNPKLPFTHCNGRALTNEQTVDYTNGAFPANAPQLVVQYDNEQKVEELTGLSEDEVEATLQRLALSGLTLTTPPQFETIDILHSYHPPLPPFRLKLGPGWQYADV